MSLFYGDGNSLTHTSVSIQVLDQLIVKVIAYMILKIPKSFNVLHVFICGDSYI